MCGNSDLDLEFEQGLCHRLKHGLSSVRAVAKVLGEQGFLQRPIAAGEKKWKSFSYLREEPRAEQ